jgi:anti-sigma B factor antagonist
MPQSATPIVVTSTASAGDVMVVRVEGEVDIATAPLVADELLVAMRPPAPTMVLADFDAVTFMGSAGLQALLRAHQYAQRAATQLRIVATGRAVLRPLELMGMLAYLDVYPTAAAARAGLTPSTAA